MNFDLGNMTVRQIQSDILNQVYTAEALTRSAIDQMNKVNPKYNAVIIENPDAIRTAKEIDSRIAEGKEVGSLAGVPVVVKDPMDMKGIPTTAGWHRLYSKKGGVDLIPEKDSPVVARLREADAIILGKTNVPILSWTGSHANDSWAGPTINPVIEDRLPGGSSAGTAAAVASHIAVFGLAEETGGSIQNPASAQALVGIKPTIGLVPNVGVVPLSGNRDVVGPIAKTVEDAALALDVLVGYTSEDPKTLASVDKTPSTSYTSDLSLDNLEGKRLGLYGPGWRPDRLSSETEELYKRAKSELESRGAILLDDPFGGSNFASLRKITPGTPFFDGRGLESIAFDMGNYLERFGPESPIKNWEQFVEATNFDELVSPGSNLAFLYELPDFVKAIQSPNEPPELTDFIKLKKTYLHKISKVFIEFKLDALVYPQMLEEIPGLFSGNAIRETTVGELNIAGLPAVTVPAGYYQSGAPFELIFLGLQWTEKELIEIAFAYEQSTSHRRSIFS